MKEHKISLSADSPFVLKLDIPDGCEMVWQSQKELEPYVEKTEEEALRIFYPASASLRSGFYVLNVQIIRRDTGQEVKSERYLVRVKTEVSVSSTPSKDQPGGSVPSKAHAEAAVASAVFQEKATQVEKPEERPFDIVASQKNGGDAEGHRAGTEAFSENRTLEPQTQGDTAASQLITDVPQTAAEGWENSMKEPPMELWEALNHPDIMQTERIAADSLQSKPVPVPDPIQPGPVVSPAPDPIQSVQAPPVQENFQVGKDFQEIKTPDFPAHNIPQAPDLQPAPVPVSPQNTQVLPVLDGDFEVILLRNNVLVSGLEAQLARDRTTTVGRDVRCDLSLSDQFFSRDEEKKCSRQQLDIYWMDDAVCVKNTGRNSVYFADENSTRISPGNWIAWDPAVLLQLPGGLSLQLRRIHK
ncbi:MAG: FHA domain-containing protein [Candidatus Hydrogenedens sp.]|jgi:hypothetical protein|nr:FHA domain-containing protein [Candidatus Hydrogenedens sp.]